MAQGGRGSPTVAWIVTTEQTREALNWLRSGVCDEPPRARVI
jgi:hypothetical protein